MNLAILPPKFVTHVVYLARKAGNDYYLLLFISIRCMQNNHLFESQQGNPVIIVVIRWVPVLPSMLK